MAGMRVSIPIAAPGQLPLLRDGWRWVRGFVRRWRQRARARAELQSMDTRALADIGMDRESARRETRKFFWQD